MVPLIENPRTAQSTYKSNPYLSDHSRMNPCFMTVRLASTHRAGLDQDRRDQYAKSMLTLSLLLRAYYLSRTLR